jgi:FMN phosphatase YigB (HAD superfamily)
MQSKVVLLDVDGVILRQPRVLSHVSRKIVRYVKDFTPQKMHTLMDAAEINETLYKTYGHTYLGLRALYGKEIPSLHHFHTHVYDIHMVQEIMALQKDPWFVRSKEELMRLMDLCTKHNIPMYLFSNSPSMWCEAILLTMGIFEALPSEHVLSSTHPIFQDGQLLKPMPKLYTNVATFLQQTMRDKDVQLIMVDDSLINLQPITHDPNWVPFLYKPEGVALHSKRFHTIASLDRLASYII